MNPACLGATFPLLKPAMPTPLLVTFTAGAAGAWAIDRITPVVGESLAPGTRLAVAEGADAAASSDAAWSLRGTTSHMRYTARHEAAALASVQEGLGRVHATCAALIPIRKNEAWWSLAQDERRAILEEQSHHVALGMDYLPAVARRLHHCRDLGGPFDFLTWFEYAPKDADRFDHLVMALRETPEWRFVDREVDIRLTRLA
jgi:chlorite dismutase